MPDGHHDVSGSIRVSRLSIFVHAALLFILCLNLDLFSPQKLHGLKRRICSGRPSRSRSSYYYCCSFCFCSALRFESGAVVGGALRGRRKRFKMAARTAAPIFPMPGDFEFEDQFCLGPEMDYAKVLAEADRQGKQDLIIPYPDRSRSRRQDISCFSELLKASAEDHQSAKTNRRTWKNSILGLWRKAQKKNSSPSSLTPQHPGFKSRCKPAASGPLYLNDVRSNGGPSYCRSTRTSSSLAAMFTGDAHVTPYMSLSHHNHTYNRKPVARPIYLVT